jgi:RNA polymerase sigma factor (TIGR02999 family)
MNPMSDITELLGNAAGGDTVALNQLYDKVYSELRAIAAHKMASERAGHTLQPTALVHEAFQRLGGAEAIKFENRAHFFASAAEAMRRILVDSARRHCQLKRGGDQERTELCETRIAAPVEDEKLLLVNDALDALAREDSVSAQVAKMRYFVGLKHREIADALGVSEITVHRHWAFARIRLFELIKQGSSSPAIPAPDPP